MTTMTAYAVIAILETYDEVANLQEENLNLQQTVENALKCLENNANNITQNTYDLAIVTYALTLGKSSMADGQLEKVERYSITIGNGMF